jgi:hypothetical protein
MKTIFTNFIAILVFGWSTSTSRVTAQTSSWQWSSGAGSTGSEVATGTVIDASGNLYVTGWYTSATITFGSTTLVNQGNLQQICSL